MSRNIRKVGKAIALLAALWLCLAFFDTSVSAMQLGKVSGVQVDAVKTTSVTLSWGAVYGAEGYLITTGTPYNRTEVARTSELSIEIDSIGGSPLVTGKTYTFYVQAFATDTEQPELPAEDGEEITKSEILGDVSEAVEATPSLGRPENFATEGTNYKTIQLTWDPVEDAQGYILYKATRINGPYKVLSTQKKAGAKKFKDKKCSVGVVYYYKIVAYTYKNGSRIQSEESEPIEGTTLLKAPKLSSVTMTDGLSASVKWKKVTGAKGYIVYRSTSKKGLYAKVATVDGAKTTSALVAGQENGKKYYYKVCAFTNKKKKKTYSAFSNIKNLKFNLYGSADETYMAKAKRIFGSSVYRKYQTEAEAASHQKTITIAVWDFAADGVTKITKYKSLTVHENIAPTVQQIFKEIYEGEEKFPIKNIGGYSWRGATSSSEHCEGLAIDINWEENYLIDNGVILTGKLYEPGVNPYSIPTDGEVARIMAKYGFSQGLWGDRCDYMHFSYFGS